MLEEKEKKNSKKLHFLKFHSHRKLLSFQSVYEEPTQGEVKKKSTRQRKRTSFLLQEETE